MIIKLKLSLLAWTFIGLRLAVGGAHYDLGAEAVGG